MKNLLIVILLFGICILAYKFSLLQNSPTTNITSLETNAASQSSAPNLSKEAVSPNSSLTETKEIIPTPPVQHFNDYAHVASWPYAERLEKRLKDFEWTTANRAIVVTYLRMQSKLPLADYTKRVFDAWGANQPDAIHRIVFFVFVDDHKLQIQVGSGLVTVVTNQIAQETVDEMRPYFHRGDFDRGLTSGVTSVLETIQPSKRQPTPVRNSTPGPHDRVSKPPVILDRYGYPVPMR